MRKYNYPQLFTFLIFFLSGLTTEAQVRIKVALLSDASTYQVSLRPEATYTGILGTTNSGQVTLKVPTGGFSVDDVNSNLGNWQDPLVFVSPQEAPNFDYFVFTNRGSFRQDFTNGQEVNLFTFQRSGNCTGPVEIMLSDDPFITNSLSANVGTAFTILGFGSGNAFAGNYDAGTANCGGSNNTCGINIARVLDVAERTCNGDDGSIQITASGNSSALQYSINNGSSWSNNAIYNNLAPGNYFVQVRAANNPSCVTTYLANPIILAPYSFDITVDRQAPTCETNSDGSISISTNSQDNTLQYSINNGQTFFNTAEFTGLGNDTYNIIVRESTGCESSSPDNPIIFNTTTNCTSPSDCDIRYLLTENEGVYQVSMESNVTYTGSGNNIASMQVSLRVPTGVLEIDDSCILDTYGNTEFVVDMVPSPSETPAYDYINFSIDNSFSNDITFTAGQTIPLFSFKTTNNCRETGVFELVGTGGVAIPTLSGNNVGSQLSTLGGGVDQPICVDAAAIPIVCSNSTGTPSPNCDIVYTLSENEGVYQVSLKSNVTYIGSGNNIASMQVSLRVPTGVLEIDDSCILDTYGNTEFVVDMVPSPSETPAYDYINFSIDNSFSNDITFTTGQTIPLFSFKTTNNCRETGGFELVGTGGVAIPTLSGNNVGSQLSTLGGGVDQAICVDATAIPIVCSGSTVTPRPNCDVIYIIEGPEEGIYTMKMLSNATYSTLESTISTMQITMRTPTGTLEITDDCIEENYQGTVFELVSEVINPSVTPGFDYFSFSLTSFGTNTIPFITGDTVTLFTFKGLQDCSVTGDILLVGDDGGVPVPNIATNNLAPQLFILGGGGEESNVCVNSGAVPIQCQENCPSYSIDVMASDMSDCGTSDGQIVVNVTPSENVIFSINNGSTWQTSSFFSALSAGSYDVVIAAGDTTCQVVHGRVALAAKVPPTINGVNLTQPTTCDGTGTINITATGASGVIYSINGGVNWSTNSLFTGVAVGNYDIAIANADTTCIRQGNEESLSGPSSPLILEEVIMHPDGCQATNGFIQIPTIPATGLLYSINGGTTWTTSNFFPGLGSGTYNVSVATADTACVTNGEVVVFPNVPTPTIANTEASNPLTCGSATGQITINSSPSTGLIYSVNGGSTWQTGNVFMGLAAGTYPIQVATNDTSCVATGSPVTLADPDAPSIVLVNFEDPTTCSSEDGHITINSNPSTGLIYSIDGGSTWSNNNNFLGLGAGFYSIRLATPDTICAVVGSSFSLENPTEPVVISATPTPATQCDGSNGQISITSSPAFGIIYSIDGGTNWSTSRTFTNLSSGNYDIRIAYPDTSCIEAGSILSLPEIPAPSFTSSQVGACIEVTASCEGDFEYSLDGVTWQPSNLFCDLEDDTYRPRARCLDLSCTANAGVVVINGSTPAFNCAVITNSIPNITLCNEESTPVSVTIDRPFTSYSITGGTSTNEQVIGDTTLQFNAHLNGQINFFAVTLQTQAGCEVEEEFVLYQAQNTEADFVVIEPFCMGDSVTIQFTGTATPNAQLTWTVGEDGIIIDSSGNTTEPANSIITVEWPAEGSKLIELMVDDNGCTDEHIESIFVRKLPRVTLSPDTTICFGTCLPLHCGGTGVWYTWSPAEGLNATDIPNPIACPTTTTTYTVDVMGADGCVTSKQVTIAVEEVECTISADTAICIGGTASLAATGGVSYAWFPAVGLNSTTVSNPIATPSETTTYTVTITNERGCTTEKEVMVAVENLPSIFILGDPQICEGESVQFQASVHAEYLWSPAGSLSSTTISNPIASPTTTTTYTLTVASAIGCSSTSQYTVEVLPKPTAIVGPNQTICLGDVTQLTASGGIAYEWSPTTNLINATSPTPTVSPTSTTTYTVTVTSANNCTDVASTTVNIKDLNVQADQNGRDIIEVCPNEVIILTASGGATYSWSPTTNLTNPNSATTTVLGVSELTTYVVTAEDSDGCSGEDMVTIVPKDIADCSPCPIFTNADTTICGDGSVQLMANMVGGQTYSWEPATGLSNPNISNPIATPSQTTQYIVTGITQVTPNDSGCIARDTITITVADAPQIITYKEKEICRGDSIHLLVNKHEDYQWSSNTGANSMIIESPEAPLVFPTVTTIYTVTVTSENGCTNTENITVTVNENCGCRTQAGPNRTICEGDFVVLNASGSVSYSWFPTTGLSNPTIANPTATPIVTTQYTVTGIDADGCVSNDQVTIFVNERPTIITYTEKEVCNGESVQLLVNSHESYAWSPTTNLDLTNPEAPIASPTVNTNYTVTVTGANGCTNSETIQVTVLYDCAINCQTLGGTPPEAIACEDKTICLGDSIDLIVNNHQSYDWSPKGSLINANTGTPIAFPTTTTVYTVTVTNEDGCTDTDEVVVFVTDCGTTQCQLQAGSNVTVCQGQSIPLNASGAGNYSWSPATGLSNANIATPIASPNTTTTYTVTETKSDGSTCTDQVTVFVREDTPEAIACEDKTICLGDSIDLVVNNHQFYDWSPKGSLINATTGTPKAFPTTTTTYTVTVTNADGCTDTDEVVVFVNDCSTIQCQLEAGSDIVICQGQSIFLNASGGDNYSWSPSTGLSSPNISTPSASPSVTTTYTVTETKSDGSTCTDQVTVFVREDRPEAIACEDKTICLGDSIDLIVNNHQFYDWSPKGSLINANTGTPTAFPTTTTTYTVTVTNADGCTDTDEVVIFVNDCSTIQCQLEAGSDVVICQGQSIFLNASGGDNYSWSPSTGLSSPNISTPSASPSVTTTYTVTETKSDGSTCRDQVTVFVREDTPEAIACEDKTICLGDSIMLTINNHQFYDWSPKGSLINGNTGTPIVFPTTTTTYTVTVTNADGCTDTDEVVIFVNDCGTTQCQLDAGSDITICQGQSMFLNATGGENYTWSPTTNLTNPNVANPIAFPSVTTVYTVTETRPDGSTCTDQVTVIVGGERPVAIASEDKTICLGDSIELSINNHQFYDWAPKGSLINATTGTPTVFPTTTTTYVVTVTNADGCTDTDDVVVFVNNCGTSQCQLEAGSDITICQGQSMNLSASGGDNYSWSPTIGLSNPNIAIPIATPSVTTTYTVTETRSDGSTCMDQVTVFVRAEVPEAIACEDKTICLGDSIMLTINNHQFYDWSPKGSLINGNTGTPIVFPTTTTTYTVTVTNADGCTDTDEVVVFVNDCGTIRCQLEAGTDVTICQGQSMTLSASGGDNYSWSPTTGLSNPNIAVPIASPSVTTTYTVTETKSDGSTCRDQVTVFVRADVPEVIVCEDKTICIGDSIYLLVNPHQAYDWSPKESLTGANTATPHAFPTTTTVYTVTVTSADGCTGTEQVTVFVSDCSTILCQLEAGSDITICQGQSMFLNATGGVNYTWSPTTNLTNPNIANPIASPSVTTVYTVTETKPDGNTCTDQVTVFVGGERPMAVACEDKTICEGESTQLTVNNHQSYDWAPKVSLINDQTGAPTAFPTTTTTYVVTVTNADGCTDTDEVTVFVTNCETPPPSCEGLIFAEAGRDIVVCPGASETLQASGGISYEWSPATGLSDPTIANPMVTPTSTTIYTVTVTNADGCTDTDDLEVIVSLPIMTSINTTKAGCCGEGGGSITINASGGFGNLTYNWGTSGLVGSVVSNLEMGTYTVTISDGQGCTKVEEVIVGSDCESCPTIFESERFCSSPGAILAEVCLPMLPSEIPNYIITVDGVRVDPSHGCDFENMTSYSFAILPELLFPDSFRIESWTVNEVAHSIDIMTIADLTNWMNTIDAQGFWRLNNNEFTLSGGVPTTTYGPIKIVNLSDWSEATLQPSTAGRATGTLLEVDVSDGEEHVVVIEDPRLCCREELIVVDCTGEQPCLDNMIAADLLELTTDTCGGTTTFCIEIPPTEISNYTISQNGVAYQGGITTCSFEGNDGSSFVVEEGTHEFIFENGANGCQDRLIVEVGCPANIKLNTTIEVGATATLCITDFIDETLLNTVRQSCLIGGNELLDIVSSSDYCWSYTGLTEGVERFCIEVCTVDGTCRDVIVTVTIVPAEIVCPEDNMVTMSNSVENCMQAASFCLEIPFDSLRAYGMMLDGRPYRETVESCDTNIQFNLPVGNHILVLTHLATGCTRTYNLKVSCNPAIKELTETIFVNEIDTLCLDLSDLPGTVVSMENICPTSAGTAVAFELDTENYCVYFTGIEEGQGKACLVICDANGICDTIELTVFVLDDAPLLPDAVSDSLIVEMNNPMTLRVIENDKINGNLKVLEVTTYPRIGEAIMNNDNTITYIPENEYCELNEPETFNYRLCNEDGCDTAIITIRIPCQDFEVKTGFSPNGDGVNDVFYIQGLQRFPENELKVFNRWGTLVYQAKEYQNDWSGTFEGKHLPSGTYFYVLKLGDGSKPLDGYVQIQR